MIVLYFSGNKILNENSGKPKSAMSTNSKSKISHLDLKKFSMRDRLLAFSSIFAGLTDDKFLFYVPFIERIFKHCL